MTRLILTLDAWLAEVARYLGVQAQEGWAVMVVVMKIARTSKQLAKLYGYIDHEAEQHDQQMAYLRAELDQCRRRLYQQQHELQQLREAA